MKILITCYRLDLSGSSTYTLTLASELKKRQHSISVFTLFPDELTKEFEKKGIKIFSELAQICSQDYNVIIGQHSIPTLLVRGMFPMLPLIFISHGVIPFLEQPPSVDINIQKYIAVSEEVKNNLIINHNIDSNDIVLIRNFIDVNRFKPQKKINNKLERVLFISNHKCSDVRQNIEKACKKLKLEIIFIGRKKHIFEVEKYINKVDLVISLGRGILESMSCGRAVIVYDYNGGDGIITKNNIFKIRKKNFSGRVYHIKYGVTDLVQEIRKYDLSMYKTNRKIILRDYNVSLSATKIEQICKEVLLSFKPKQIFIPTKELIWCCQKQKLVYPDKKQSKKQIVLNNIKEIIKILKRYV